jgi:ubiquinone/menaquinone biosynthesis C-methylase UbiE
MSIATPTVREGGKRGAYDHVVTPFAFDVLIRAVFAPLGGICGLRSRALDLLDVKPGVRVLELGCGTGGITRQLLERGAVVTAVDGSYRMLCRARRRAPHAQLIHARLEEFEPTGTFDRVLFAFVLHELSAPDRHAALSKARQAVTPGGLVAVLDWSVPPGDGLFARAWRAFLQNMEPPSVADCLDGCYEAELVRYGLRIVRRHGLAAGTVQMVQASREQ